MGMKRLPTFASLALLAATPAFAGPCAPTTSRRPRRAIASDSTPPPSTRADCDRNHRRKTVTIKSTPGSVAQAEAKVGDLKPDAAKQFDEAISRARAADAAGDAATCKAALNRLLRRRLFRARPRGPKFTHGCRRRCRAGWRRRARPPCRTGQAPTPGGRAQAGSARCRRRPAWDSGARPERTPRMRSALSPGHQPLTRTSEHCNDRHCESRDDDEVSDQAMVKLRGRRVVERRPVPRA